MPDLYLVRPSTAVPDVATGDATAYEFGYEFACATAEPVTALGWYRPDVGAPKATGLRLWDTTTGTAVLAVTAAGSIVDDGTVGWQFTDVTALGYTLVAGRHYRVAYGHPSGHYTARAAGLPGTPDAGLTGYGQYYTAFSPGSYPNTTHTYFFGNSVRVGAAAEPEPPAGATTTVRTTTLEVYVHDGAAWQYVGGAYAASCSFGFDQRVAEATVRRTGGGEAEVQYWSPIRIDMGCTPGHGLATRFLGYVVPVDNALYPVEGTLTCKGRLYRAQWVRNQTPGGTVMAEPPAGVPDETQVGAILTACGVPYTAGNLGGTGKALGSVFFDFDNPVVPGPFTWAEGAAGLDYVEQLDAVSVPDDASGRYRTFETLNGEVFRTKMATAPESTPDFSFAEGVDVLEARITRDPTGAANRVTVTGAPTPLDPEATGVADLDVYRFTATTPDAPYLPPGLPDGPDGYPQVAATFASPMIEKSLTDDEATPTFARLWGTDSDLAGVHSWDIAFLEVGTRFYSPDDAVLTGVRWYRLSDTHPVPSGVRLWDSTSTGAPLYELSAGEQAPFADLTVGWKAVTLTTPQPLVGGRNYVLSYGCDGAPFPVARGGTRAPDAPLAGLVNVQGALFAYPADTSGDAYLLDAYVEYPGAPGGADVISCEAVATFLLAEHNCVLDTLEFSTPRDDLLGPGQTIHLESARLGITDPDQHYWLQRLEVTVDERGAFTQRLTCLRRS